MYVQVRTAMSEADFSMLQDMDDLKELQEYVSKDNRGEIKTYHYD